MIVNVQKKRFVALTDLDERYWEVPFSRMFTMLHHAQLHHYIKTPLM